MIHPGCAVARRKRRGIAAVELAVLAPFLVFLLVITVDFARVFYYQVALTNCARNGALYASNLKPYTATDFVNQSSDPITTQFNVVDNAKAVAIQDGSALNPAVTTSMVAVTSGTGSDGNPNVTVTVTYSFALVTQYVGLPSSYTLTATTKMRVNP